MFTSESVSEGHPDKVSDQISDAILDAFIAKDVELGIADDSQINTRLGCETLCTTNKIVIAGEGRGQLFHTIHGQSVVDRELITKIARDVVKGDALTVGPLMSTMMACPDPAGTFETQFLTALQNSTKWSVSAGELDLRDDSGAQQVAAQTAIK